ncbi:MAG: polymer-forming cytoskeletal protein [Thermoflexaceae bacterium]|nr:polymer-forming cytoskeletal protein [Thermoflexaceae bacterium]
MGFFDELKKEISQAVTELVSDEEMLQEEETSTDDTLMKDHGEDSKEYLDEDDYIETEEDYAQEKEDLGVVVDDYASDEYVNTLDIDIADLVKSYSSELSDTMNTNSTENAYMDAPVDEQSGQTVYPENNNAVFDGYYNENYNQSYGESYNADYSEADDDVMVNTLDGNFSNQDVFKVIPGNQEKTDETTAELSVENVEESHSVKEDELQNEMKEDEILPKAEPEADTQLKKELEADVLQKEEPEADILTKEESEAVIVQDEAPEEPVLSDVVRKDSILPDNSRKDLKTEQSKQMAIPHLEEEKVEKIKEDIQNEVTNELQADMKKEESVFDTADLSDETAIITKGLTVKGDLEAEGSINIFGTVEGNIQCKGKMVVSGTIYGNSETGELFANNAHINGNIVSGGSVKIGQGSIIIGNVTGTSAVIAGAVKGDIDVKGPVVVDSSAIVMGDIKSKSVQINIGAAIEGRCSQCYADVSPTAFFKES